MALKKIWLNINGADRAIVCDPEDSLADALRRIGLTGTKIGCSAGVCGACSVILNGRLVRSCVHKMKNVEERSTVLTIEGIGTAANPHPLQQAFMTYGGIQCGFCTPGFIVSAYALLLQNPAPTRAQVRHWFTVNKNACRCTGWKPLVDSVMAAAKVMRGKASMEDITYQTPANGRIYGTAVPRPAALAKATGTCDFGDDIAVKMPPGTAYLCPVMPGVHHGRIIRIDASEAEAMPGVIRVLTARDVKGTNTIMMPLPHPRSLTDGFDRKVICDEKVFRYGDVVAVVAAQSQKLAREAAKKVKVEIEELPAYMTYLEAVAPGAMEIHEGTPNEYLHAPLIKGEDTHDIIDDSEYQVEGSFYSTSQPHLLIEPDVVQAYVDDNGLLTIHCKTLTLDLAMALIPPAIGIEGDKLRMIENPTGASFGSSLSPGNTCIAGAAALALGRPVSMTLTYPQHNAFTGKRCAHYSNARMGCDENGMITGVEYDFAFDHGAYSEMADQLASKAIRFPFFGYRVPNVRALVRVGYSNQTYGTPYRAYGNTQSFTMSEAIMDMMAERIGMDPFEFRYRNLAQEGDTNLNGAVYKEYPFRGIMDKMRPYYEEMKAEAEKLNRRNIPGKRYGVGIAVGGYNVTGGADHAEVAIELDPDGGVTAYNTWEDQGQGSDVGTLVLTHEALRALDIPREKIRIVQNDTLTCPVTGPAGANRSHYMAGNATIDAANRLITAMTKEDGSLRTYEEMKAEGIPTRYTGVWDTADITTELDPNTGEGDPTPEYNYADFLALSEVDTDTGKTTVLKYMMFFDIGQIGSLQAVEGQAYGSLVHSLGFALSEEYIDDRSHAHIVQCGYRYADDVPDDIQIVDCASPRKTAPFGSVGCCEGFQCAGHMAILNSIANAVGVRVFDLPAKPEKVKALLKAKKAGQSTAPEKYYLGPDMFDILEDALEHPVASSGPGMAM